MDSICEGFMHDDSRMRWSADVSVRLIFFIPLSVFPLILLIFPVLSL